MFKDWCKLHQVSLALSNVYLLSKKALYFKFSIKKHLSEKYGTKLSSGEAFTGERSPWKQSLINIGLSFV